VKHLKSGGFVDIPVGDFKLSNLDEHPRLIVANAPVLHYRQSDGQDLCVSKLLASVLHALQFESAASQVNKFGEQMGGAVSVIKNIGNYAKTLLPNWINFERCKRPQKFRIEDCERNPEHIVLGFSWNLMEIHHMLYAFMEGLCAIPMKLLPFHFAKRL
jgi:hypothetical protein